MSPLLALTRVGEEYRILAGSASLRFRSLAPHSDGPTAILEVLDLAVGGRPHVDRLSLLSSRSRSALAKALSGRWPDHPWSDILDDACHAVDEQLSRGEPAELLEPEAPSPADCDLVEGIIPYEQITVLYADGGSLKSYFALALALAALRNEPLAPAARWCVRKCESVLYLDWETDKRTHDRRLWRLLKGLGTASPGRIAYLNMRGRPLHSSIQSVASQAERLGTDLILVDSLGMACGDEPETAVANLRTLGALSGLPGTKLVLAHVNAQTAIAPNGIGRPYGSVFIRNTARSTIEARSEQDGEHAVKVTYYHRKNNEGREMPPIAIRWSFESGGGVVLYASVPDMQHAGIIERLYAVTTEEWKKVTDIATDADIDPKTAATYLKRLKEGNRLERLDPEGVGRGQHVQYRRTFEEGNKEGNRW